MNKILEVRSILQSKINNDAAYRLEELALADPVLKEYIEFNINNIKLDNTIWEHSGPPILDLWQTIEAEDSGLSDMSEFNSFKNAECLQLSGNHFQKCSLKDLPNLKQLVIANCRLETLEGLENLPSLEILIAYENRIKDIRPIQHLKTVRYLNLDFNDIKDMSPLVGLTNLRNIYLACNYIHEVIDLSPTHEKLAYINLKHNEIIYDVRNIEAIKSMREKGVSVLPGGYDDKHETKQRMHFMRLGISQAY